MTAWGNIAAIANRIASATTTLGIRARDTQREGRHGSTGPDYSLATGVDGEAARLEAIAEELAKQIT